MIPPKEDKVEQLKIALWVHHLYDKYYPDGVHRGEAPDYEVILPVIDNFFDTRVKQELKQAKQQGAEEKRKKGRRSLTAIRMDVVQHVRDNPNIPDEFKDFTQGVVISAFNIIRSHLGAIELTFRRTRDHHADLKTPAEYLREKEQLKKEK